MPLYFALVFANSDLSLLPITGSICKPDMPFPQLIAPVFLPLFSSWYHYPMFTESVLQGYVVFIILNILSTLSTFAQIRLCPIPRFLGSGFGRQYAAISATDSTSIMVLADLRASPALLLDSFSLPLWSYCMQTFPFGPCEGSVHYVPTCNNHIHDIDYHIFIEPQCHLRWPPPQPLLINALWDHKALSSFFTWAFTYAFHISLSPKMTARYLTFFDRFN